MSDTKKILNTYLKKDKKLDMLKRFFVGKTFAASDFYNTDIVLNYLVTDFQYSHRHSTATDKIQTEYKFKLVHRKKPFSAPALQGLKAKNFTNQDIHSKFRNILGNYFNVEDNDYISLSLVGVGDDEVLNESEDKKLTALKKYLVGKTYISTYRLHGDKHITNVYGTPFSNSYTLEFDEYNLSDDVVDCKDESTSIYLSNICKKYFNVNISLFPQSWIQKQTNNVNR